MINLIIKEQEVEITNKQSFVKGTVGAKCKIIFDDFWFKYNKTVVFKHSSRKIGGPFAQYVVDQEAELVIPWEVMSKIGSFKIGAYGTTDDETLPTLWSENIPVVLGTDTYGTAPEPPSENTYDQLIDLTNKAIDTANSLEHLKQDKLTAGDNITIDENNVISVVSGGTAKADQTYNPESENAQSGKAVAEAINDKVDKITWDDIATADDYTFGVYGGRQYNNNKPTLIKATKASTPNTVAVRDGNGSISVSIGIKDSAGNNYVGGASPHTWVQAGLNYLNQKLQDAKNTVESRISNEEYNREQADKALEKTFTGKKITKYTINGGGSLTLKKNAAYIFLRDGSSNTISIYNNGTLQYGGTDDELTFETGIIIIPDNTMGSSAQYPPSYYSLAIKISSKSSVLGIPNVNSAKFSVLKEVMESGDLMAKENSGSSTFSVWEIAL